MALLAGAHIGAYLTLKLHCTYEGLRFIPLSPPSESSTVLAWKKTEAFPPAVTALLEHIKKCLATISDNPKLSIRHRLKTALECGCQNEDTRIFYFGGWDMAIQKASERYQIPMHILLLNRANAVLETQGLSLPLPAQGTTKPDHPD